METASSSLKSTGEEPFDVMVLNTNPEDFINWPRERKLERYERVIAWHDYISDLHNQGKAPIVWGAHQLLSPSKFAPVVQMGIAVYRVQSWLEFDRLLLRDPLRDVSRYITIPLASVADDKESDTQRLDKVERLLFPSGDRSTSTVYPLYRQLYMNKPSYVGQYKYAVPSNPPTDLNRHHKPGDPMQFLVIGQNPPELVGQWDDMRKYIHYQKVLWWQDYVSMLTEQKKLTYAWGVHDFCDSFLLADKVAQLAMSYEVQSFDEFDALYKLDPTRDSTLFITILLQPIADQKTLDEETLAFARRGAIVTRKPAIEIPQLATQR